VRVDFDGAHDAMPSELCAEYSATSAAEKYQLT
jgi:hypothetical protein